MVAWDSLGLLVEDCLFYIILLSSYIGYLLGNTFCIISDEGSCLTSVLTYVGVINVFNLIGVFILVNLSEKSITEWNQNLEEE